MYRLELPRIKTIDNNVDDEPTPPLPLPLPPIHLPTPNDINSMINKSINNVTKRKRKPTLKKHRSQTTINVDSVTSEIGHRKNTITNNKKQSSRREIAVQKVVEPKSRTTNKTDDLIDKRKTTTKKSSKAVNGRSSNDNVVKNSHENKPVNNRREPIMRTNSSPLPTVVSYITLDEIIAAARRKSPDFRPGSIPTRHHYHRQIKSDGEKSQISAADIEFIDHLIDSDEEAMIISGEPPSVIDDFDDLDHLVQQVRPPKDAFSNPIIHDADPLRMLLLAERKAAKHHHYRDVHLDDDNEDELQLIRDDDDDDRMSADFSVVDLSTTSQMSLDSAYDDVEFATDRLNSLKSPSAALLPSFVGNL